MMKEIVFRRKHVEFLIELFSQGDGTFIRKVCKKVDLTDSCSFKLVKSLEDKGIVETKKVGRMKKIFITEKGKEFAALMFEVGSYIL